MSSAEEVSLALTAWGSTTLDAIQSATEETRTAIGRQACEDAIADARSMACLQGSLFEKLLVIERFGLYREHLIPDGESTRGCESIQEFLEHAVAPVVRFHRTTFYRLREAVEEAGRLLGAYGSVKTDWTHLSLLAVETRRQLKGEGVLAPEQYDEISRRVAEGTVSRRDVKAALRPARKPGGRKSRPSCAGATRPDRRRSPLEELARITAEVRRPAGQPEADLDRTTALVREVLAELERLSLRPADAWRGSTPLPPCLVELLEDIKTSTTAVLAAINSGRAA